MTSPFAPLTRGEASFASGGLVLGVKKKTPRSQKPLATPLSGGRQTHG